ncbi:hypothetical protein E2C01_046323 [Portunus trituberculatus]|uniref:Uncharacterized protein n=1 Tax=Portunus trituberculatus TaxID=210409 RepID=A0A5B7G5F7_PORTR|nr:hypothetical protein [Portunus trituberculatus]
MVSSYRLLNLGLACIRKQKITIYLYIQKPPSSITMPIHHTPSSIPNPTQCSLISNPSPTHDYPTHSSPIPHPATPTMVAIHCRPYR